MNNHADHRLPRNRGTIPRSHISPQGASVTKLLHLVSDSTGETTAILAASAQAHFPTAEIEKRMHIFVRSDAEADRVAADIADAPGLVLITMVDLAQKDRIKKAAQASGSTVVDILDPVVSVLSQHLNLSPELKPGAQYSVDDFYLRRIDAIDYAIDHDDGASADRLSKADVILTGVSRTSKTPTCIYLACRGIKAANLPLVPGVAAPQSLIDAAENGVPVVGLTASPNRLAQIRSERLESMGHEIGDDYAEIDLIRREVSDARLLFDRLGAPIIDVTRRSIEETAAAVMAILRDKGAAR